MINESLPIGTGPNINAGVKKLDVKVEKEPSIPLSEDLAVLGFTPEKLADRDVMRKASIEYYALHRGNRTVHHEPPAETHEAAASTENTGPNATISRVPKFISLKDIDDIGLQGAIKGEGYDVGPFEKQLAKDLGPNARVQNDWDIDGLKGKIPTLTELQETFDECSKDKSIPWEYLPDGCYARGHVSAGKFLDKGYDCAKMYVMIGDAHPDNPFAPFPSYRLKAHGKFTDGEWWYHVAPVVFAKDEKSGQVDGYIIDPAVNREHPLKAKDWVKSFWSGDFPIQFDTTHADIYEPQAQDLNPTGPHEFSKDTFDKWMPEAKKTNKEYMATLKEIKAEYYAHHPDQTPDNKGKA